MHSSNSIDLAKKQSSLSDEIIKWALSFGRLLIIVVEIVAFAAFVSRFWYDRELVDLNDKIEVQKIILEASEENEKDYRNLHERLAIVRTIDTTGNNNLKIFNDIVAKTPEGITYNAFDIEKGEVLIELNVTVIPALTEYLESLQGYKELTSVAITGIDNSSGTNAVKITIQAQIKGEATNNDNNSEEDAEE